MISFRALPALAAVVLSAIAGAASAALPAPVKQEHPRLFTDAAGFNRLREQLPLLNSPFPAEGGSISFSFLPKQRLGDDKPDLAVFGKNDTSKNGIFIRHREAGDVPGHTVRLQLVLQKAGGTNVAGAVFDVEEKGDASTIVVSWDSAKRTVKVSLNDKPIAISWPSGVDWRPDGQSVQFNPRQGEEIRAFKVRKLDGTLVADFPAPESALNNAWSDLLAQADASIATLNNCPPLTAKPPNPCNVGGENRHLIFSFGQQLALTYKLSKDPRHLAAALLYIKKMLEVDVVAGTEWSMGGRIGALGVMYDWLYEDLGIPLPVVPQPGPPLPNVQGPSYRQAMAATIKRMIVATIEPGREDLAKAMCGKQGPIDVNAVDFDCPVKPVFEKWDRIKAPDAPNTATAYLGGHELAAMGSTALALLALANDSDGERGSAPFNALPMLDTAYSHFEKGYFAARAFVSIDGGHHMGWAYTATTTMPERLLMWRTALQDMGGGTIFPADWSTKLIYPYIYGQRSDGNYPASGDSFESPKGATYIAFTALLAGANAADGDAMAFYRDNIIPWRRDKAPMILERLYWPATAAAAASLDHLDLSRRFRNAGQVVMRDKWNYADATLMEFKSTSFSSQNHQHLDQNSFSLYYKKPLLVDSGFYDAYNSGHWDNYYTRTIAHNSITVFDGDAIFGWPESQVSNDGGQWYQDPKTVYPTLEEVLPNGPNALAGIEAYEYAANDQGAFTYTRGNASKAYSAAKLDQEQGFVRSMVFLRQPSFGAGGNKPVAVIFDRVVSKRTLPATFLLHSVNKPALSGVAKTAVGGRYPQEFAAGGKRIATIRNGTGMVSVQTLLPLDANIDTVGGMGVKGQQCAQRVKVKEEDKIVLKDAAPSEDCRFLVRERQAPGPDGKPVYEWRNFKLATDDQKEADLIDVGNWRLEISDSLEPAKRVAGAPQYFLHVLSVADNDNGVDNSQTVARGVEALRLGGGSPDTEAVLLDGKLIVAFNRAATPAGSLGWTAAGEKSEIIASGLKPSTGYRLTTIPSGGEFKFELKEVVAQDGVMTSSADGVLRIPPR